MTSIVYLGNLPKASQVVSSDLRARGINLLKAAPSDLRPFVLADVSPNYAIYRTHLSSYIRAAELESTVLLNDPYRQFGNKAFPSFYRAPSIIWSFDVPPTEERRDAMKGEFDAEDTLSRGKPALHAIMTLKNIRDLISKYSPLEVTPSTPSSLNIAAYKQLVVLYRLFDTVCKTHQYSLNTSGDQGKSLEVDESSLEKVDHMATETVEAWSTFFVAKNPRMAAHCNLTTKHGQFDYMIRSSVQIPSDSEGISFPYIVELAQPDFSTPLQVIDRFLKYCLGDSEDEVREAFDRIRSAWGNIAITSYGKEVAHMFWCLGVALESGATLRVISSSVDAYNGCLLLGKFSITVRNIIFRSANRDTLMKDFGKSSPHDTSLASIFKKLVYPSDEERDEAMNDCQNIQDVRTQVGTHAVREDQIGEIRRLSLYLTFPADKRPLSITGFNISKILDAIADESTDEADFPLYPPAITFSNRRERLWAAFGSIAPSFLVPGGKKMHLGESFEVSVRGKEGQKISRSVKKIGIVMKPLSEALIDLKTVIDEKTIFNPHGSSIMARSSSSALIKTLDGDQCVQVVVGLRRIAQVTISDVARVGKEKRKTFDDREEGPSRKKSRIDEL